MTRAYVITGGTGTLGKELVRQLLEMPELRPIIVFSRCEYKQAMMKQEFKNERIRYKIGDVRSLDDLRRAVPHNSNIIHTAALKRVEKGEEDPVSFMQTNILGTQNVMDVARETNSQVIFTSTDKAVSPINHYGATKMVAEKLVTSQGGWVVRYGNVIASRGSVFEKWKQLADAGAHLPVAKFKGVADCTRYFIELRTVAGAILDVSRRLPDDRVHVIYSLPANLTEIARFISDKIHIYPLPSYEKVDECLEREDLGSCAKKHMWDVKKLLDAAGVDLHEEKQKEKKQ